jgi:carboxyl-terminal processing protease
VVVGKLRNFFQTPALGNLRSKWFGSNNPLGLTAIIVVLSLLIAFTAGEIVGHSRDKSAVDESITQVLKKDPNSPQRSVLERAAIEAILKATGDQWANYFPKEATKLLSESLQGRYSGIGIWVRKNSSGVVEVSSVQAQSPAALAGIKVLDAISDINGESMDGASIATAVAALRGLSSTPVQIGLVRDQKAFRLSVKRAPVLNGDVTATQIAANIVYIQISAISSHVTADVEVALARYPHSKGIILDLRDNPGGMIDEAVDLASIFLSEGSIVSYTRKGESDRLLSSTNSAPDTSPMVVLVNRSTASSAEVITGALQDRNRAVIIGERTYGKGTVQEVISLSDGSQLEVTVGKYRTPSGRIIDGAGISPDLLVPESTELTKAVLVLSGLASLDESRGSSSK